MVHNLPKFLKSTITEMISNDELDEVNPQTFQKLYLLLASKRQWKILSVNALYIDPLYYRVLYCSPRMWIVLWMIRFTLAGNISGAITLQLFKMGSNSIFNKNSITRILMLYTLTCWKLCYFYYPKIFFLFKDEEMTVIAKCKKMRNPEE